MRQAKGPFADAGGTRRMFMKGLLTLGSTSALLALPGSGRTAEGEKPGEIRQPDKADKEHFIRRAFEMRRIAEQRGDQPYGAVIVQDGQVVGEGASGVIVKRDPTAHGEVEAIRDACRRLGTNDLSGCEIYSTAKPCPMCETACYWARISRIYYGAPITDAGPPRYLSC